VPIRLYESYLTNFAFANGDDRMKFTLKDYQDEAVLDVLDRLKKARKRWRRGPRPPRLFADRRHRRGQDGHGGRCVRGALSR
jgi:hypothetical protein